MSLSFPEKMGIIYHASLNFFKVKDVSKVDQKMILTRLLSDSDIEFLGELGESDVEGLADPKEINDYMERSKANIEQKLRTVKIIGVSKGTLIIENCYIPRGTNVISFSNNALDLKPNQIKSVAKAPKSSNGSASSSSLSRPFLR